MGISNIFTILLYIIPIIVQLLYDLITHDNPDYIVLYSSVSTNLNPLANIAILVLRQNDIKESLMKKFPVFQRTIRISAKVAPPKFAPSKPAKENTHN
ncbi:unnamed protein product [Dracunculus medinensis]|uniref:G_PROTEIN_RECEP_F1_2 domain-containing protein n=1 Tax=Dracunculus medinensis TaxID=318479 RepID=A0A0N4UIZ5_DRAME|nr:unnamed protein product [Dracunculus medinensis]